MSDEFRPTWWKRELEYRIGDFADSYKEYLELLVGDLLVAYLESEDFAEEACQYCESAGWKRPD